MTRAGNVADVQRRRGSGSGTKGQKTDNPTKQRYRGYHRPEGCHLDNCYGCHCYRYRSPALLEGYIEGMVGTEEGWDSMGTPSLSFSSSAILGMIGR